MTSYLGKDHKEHRRSGDGHSQSGPSTLRSFLKAPIRHRSVGRRRRVVVEIVHLVIVALLAATLVTSHPSIQHMDDSRLRIRRGEDVDPEMSLGNIIRRRTLYERAYGPNQVLDFEVNVTPPRTCSPMNITFSTIGGKPPFTIFVGFSDWYPYTIQLPASYADPDVTTWLYKFDVPVFRPIISPSLPTPNSVVIVSDSTGNLMNTSRFQTVVEGDTSCAPVTGKVDFTFYTDPTITACSPMGLHWSSTTSPIASPLDAFLVREQQPPIHIPIANASAGVLTYNLTEPPGTNVLFTMTDLGGNGGVSGKNVVGGSEYIGMDCLNAASSSIFPLAVPSPTATLSSARMPDYTASITTVITSNGVVRTAVAVEIIKHGSNQNGGGGLAAGGIAGLAVGIAMVAAIIAAIVSWCVWRRRNGRLNLSWDVPKSMEGDLSKGNEPIDQAFLRNRNRPLSRIASATQPIMPNAAISPTSDTSLTYSRHTPPWDNSSSPSVSRRYGNLSTALSPYEDTSSQDISTTQGSIPMIRRCSGSNSSIVSNPFANSHALASRTSLRSQRQQSQDRSRGRPSTSGIESLPSLDLSRYQSTPASYDSRPTNPTFVQHSDAGLLMDDSLDDADENGQIELPPQYSSVPMRSNPTSSSGAAYNRSDADQAYNEESYTHDEEAASESEFWQTAGEPYAR